MKALPEDQKNKTGEVMSEDRLTICTIQNVSNTPQHEKFLVPNTYDLIIRQETTAGCNREGNMQHNRRWCESGKVIPCSSLLVSCGEVGRAKEF